MDQTKLFTEERIKQLFKTIDKDGNGTVDKQELLELLQSNFVFIEAMECHPWTGRAWTR